MFGGIGKRIKKEPAIIENDEPAIEETKVNSCDDEPKEWSKYSESELAAAWYRLESLSLGQAKQPQIDLEDIFQWYLNAAAQGDRCAQYAVGKMYHRGILTQSVLFQAGIWYSKASDGGSPFADLELAKMSEYGITMPKDADLAANLYKKAYGALVDIESRSPDRAVEKKLAALCDKQAAADPQEATHWKQLAEQPIQHASIVENEGPQHVTVSAKKEKDEADQTNQDKKSKTMNLEDIPVQYIFPSKSNKYAEHDTDESVHALSLSIQVNGLIYPLVLNRISDTEYRIIAGEKRFKAITQYLHWESIPAVIQSKLSTNKAQSMLNAANLDVREYTSGQKLQFYMDYEQRLRELQGSGEFTGSLQDGIAELLGVSSHQIRKYQRIVEMLPPKRLKQIQAGELSIEKAYKMTLSKGSRHESGTRKAPEAIKTDHGRASVSTSKLYANEGHKSIPTMADPDVEDESETASGRTSDFSEISGVATGTILRDLTPSADVETTSGNESERTSVSGENPNVTEEESHKELSPYPDVKTTSEITSGSTSVFEQRLQDNPHNQGDSSDKADVPNVPENAIGRTSVFAGNQDVTTGAELRDLASQEDEENASENSNGRTSVLIENPGNMDVEGLAVFQPPENKRNTAEISLGRASVLDENPAKNMKQVSISSTRKTDVKNASDVTSVFQNPGSYQEAIEMLTELPAEPGDNCTVIEGSRAIPGVIDRIELYSDALMLSVSVNGTARSYPVSQIGKTLFIGGEKEAGSA